eukprot:103139_1
MATTNNKESNGHNTNNSETPKQSTPSKDNLLMKHIIDHLRSKGLDHAADSLQSESDQKSNGHLAQKRSFSEMSTEPSYLSQLHDRNTNRNTTNTNTANQSMTWDEQVISATDFSLQSFGQYEQLFSQTNKSKITCASFSSDGLFNCIGSCDGTIRIFDVHKQHQSCNFNSLIKKYDSNSYSAIHRPLMSTLITPGHGSATIINEIDFYPNQSCQQLTSCTAGAIHFYEFNKNKNRKSPISSIHECFNVKSVQYHPSGNYVIAGGEACYVRLYDIKKEQGYIAHKNKDNNDYNINQIRWSLNGNIFASCSDGGDIRLYDGRSMNVVNILKKHHKSEAITSIRFSKDCKYLLSAGYDHTIRLCDLRVGKQCMQYKDCKSVKENTWYKPSACFTYNDEHVLTYSNVMNRIFVYDTNSGHKIYKFKDYQGNDNKNGITCLVASPTEPAFTCATSNDNKSRFYATIKQMAIDRNDQNNTNNNNDNK